MIDIFGIDFTSTPTRRKHITCLHARLQDSTLRVERLSRWASLGEFESFLTSPGPWLAGMDFPFGFARRFIETMGWPLCWESYISALGDMDRATFRAQLDHYRTTRAPGDKEHRRWADKLASAISPQKLYGTPVGLMLFEGATRLQRSTICLPGLRPTEDSRVALECYPALLARRYIGRQAYKNDDPAKQSSTQRDAREALWRHLQSDDLLRDYGVRLDATPDVIDDPSGDAMDALLCAIQAAWAAQQGTPRFGQPLGVDSLEGWINDPLLSTESPAGTPLA